MSIVTHCRQLMVFAWPVTHDFSQEQVSAILYTLLEAMFPCMFLCWQHHCVFTWPHCRISPTSWSLLFYGQGFLKISRFVAMRAEGVSVWRADVFLLPSNRPNDVEDRTWCVFTVARHATTRGTAASEQSTRLCRPSKRTRWSSNPVDSHHHSSAAHIRVATSRAMD